MERSGILRWLFFAGAILILISFGPKLCGNGETQIQPLKFESAKAAPIDDQRERFCDLWSGRFRARLGTRGASIKKFQLTTAKYQRRESQEPIELSTTPDLPLHQQLRLHWRNEAAKKPDVPWQVDYDLLHWNLEQSNGKSCVFTYSDEKVALKKTVATTDNPYELRVEAEITNLASDKARHALTAHTVAWRTNEETSSKMFRVSPFITHVECVLQGGDAVRHQPDDFEPEDFQKEAAFQASQLNLGDWYQVPGVPDIAAVSNAYFTHALVPLKAPNQPVCQLQIEERWDSSRYKSKGADPKAGAMYRARLAYQAVDLAPHQSAKYSLLSYIGPKERDALAAAGDGQRNLKELIDLGFFSSIAKVLVWFLLKVYSVIPNWGIAIIVLTLTARMLLFPLAIPSIKSMIKMRELKPELDALTEKYKNDAQAKGLAQMELWRKHNVNPLKGCLPQLASMPVWFALYTTLQTAVELYNIPFLWFPDLSEPDPLFILPFIIGGTSFIQQKLMPMQGDPAQQKMLLYFMPAMFTVFMLFLPAGLGVYMFTNSLLGIVQQQTVEWHVRRNAQKAGGSGADIEVKIKEESGSKGVDKGKKAKRDKAKPTTDSKLTQRDPLLGKGKA
jgi:YidC/Oxa1 family membrane protein insertase